MTEQKQNEKKPNVFLDSILSMLVPFYNVYLVNRAEKNLGYTNPFYRMGAVEVGFLCALYSALDGQIDNWEPMCYILGVLGRTKGIAWGSLREADKENYQR
jgi:hypothetical protein